MKPRCSSVVAACAFLAHAAVGAPATLDSETSATVADRAFFPVGAVEFREDLERGAVATMVRTPFGSTPTKAPQFVMRKFDWDAQRIDVRGARAMYDLDFSTTVEIDPEAVEPVETAVLLSSGRLQLTAGPDVFVFCANENVSGIRVAPLLRTPDGRFAPGHAVEMGAASLGRVSPGVFGFGVDLDAWADEGLIPENAILMGVVIIHDGAPGTGALNVTEIVGSDSPIFSETGGPGGGGGSPRMLSLGGSGGRGAGGGGPAEPEEPIPSPGAGLVLGVGLAVAASRRRR